MPPYGKAGSVDDLLLGSDKKDEDIVSNKPSMNELNSLVKNVVSRSSCMVGSLRHSPGHHVRQFCTSSNQLCAYWVWQHSLACHWLSGELASAILNLPRNPLLDYSFGHLIIRCYMKHHIFPRLSHNMCLKIKPVVSSYLMNNGLPYNASTYISQLSKFYRQSPNLLEYSEKFLYALTLLKQSTTHRSVSGVGLSKRLKHTCDVAEFYFYFFT